MDISWLHGEPLSQVTEESINASFSRETKIALLTVWNAALALPSAYIGETYHLQYQWQRSGHVIVDRLFSINVM